ncbi:uncharacterized protein METZ01_LOCUS376227, partial [marine metagenome]
VETRLVGLLYWAVFHEDNHFDDGQSMKSKSMKKV